MENTLKMLADLGLSGASLGKLTKSFEKHEFAKNHLLIREGRIEKSLYFLEKGVARAYFQKDDKEITFCFNTEGEVILSLKSYFANQPGYESIELLEDSIVYKISHRHLHALFSADIQLANWGRKLAEREFIKADERFMAQQFKTAAERYEDFLISYPDLIRRVQLGHIASYLGISQVSLSRIRASRN